MSIWDDFTGTTAKRNAAKGLENYNNQQANIYADKTQQQFGSMAGQHDAFNGTQQLDGLNNVNAWLDPSMAYQKSQATNSVLGAFGNQGKLFSGSAMKALSDRQQGIASQGWQQAMNNYMNQQNSNNQMAMQGNAQNFNNNFQTASMINQADATKFNTATQGRANVASIQGPSAWDAVSGVGKLAGVAAATYFGGPAGGAAATKALY